MRLRLTIAVIVLVLVLGYLLPSNLRIPVAGASENDWNHETFWHYPWGKSVVHKGIDIFAKVGTPVLSASLGLVVYCGELSRGGNVLVVLGPKWRIHYYAHLQTALVGVGSSVGAGDTIATVGTTGNAAGKSPHLHYSVVTLIPYPWLITGERQGYKKMFYLNSHELLSDAE